MHCSARFHGDPEPGRRRWVGVPTGTTLDNLGSRSHQDVAMSRASSLGDDAGQPQGVGHPYSMGTNGCSPRSSDATPSRQFHNKQDGTTRIMETLEPVHGVLPHPQRTAACLLPPPAPAPPVGCPSRTLCRAPSCGPPIAMELSPVRVSRTRQQATRCRSQHDPFVGTEDRGARCGEQESACTDTRRGLPRSRSASLVRPSQRCLGCRLSPPGASRSRASVALPPEGRRAAYLTGIRGSVALTP
jgi:hypothetical protein